jgi:hypothetical protein
VVLFPFGGASIGYISALALLAVFACLLGFAMALVGCVAGTTGLFALDW